MRLQDNPVKSDATAIRGYGRHRVIIPVYIPHQEEYFAHALEITRLSLESLHRTANGRAAVTVISNGSCRRVENELQEMREAGWIEQLILDGHNRGKVNAVLAAARAAYEPFLTIADSDMLYENGWLESVRDLFVAFPECGFVAPAGMPQPGGRHAYSTIVGAWCKRELFFGSVMPLGEIERHATGLRHPLILEMNRLGQLAIQRGEVVACVGGGHMILTMRREVLAHVKPEAVASFNKAEVQQIDRPVDRAGYWRLSPARCLVRHMGNTLQPWMHESMGVLRQQTPSCCVAFDTIFDAVPPARRHWSYRLPARLRKPMVRVICRRYLPPEIFAIAPR